ncbi:SCAN domain-containing protein 3 [Trichonephila clavipes]|nr:SCAN domain-containing protein 3 [Trichonephila clavipes]
MKNITSCAADGAPNMMGKKNGCLKLMKDGNPEMILVHYVIHRQNLEAKNISPVLNEVLHNVIKCVNVIKTSAQLEHRLSERLLSERQIYGPTFAQENQRCCSDKTKVYIGTAKNK